MAYSIRYVYRPLHDNCHYFHVPLFTVFVMQIQVSCVRHSIGISIFYITFIGQKPLIGQCNESGLRVCAVSQVYCHTAGQTGSADALLLSTYRVSFLCVRRIQYCLIK